MNHFEEKPPAPEGEKKPATGPGNWHPLDRIRQQFDHLLNEFNSLPSILSRSGRFDVQPFWSGEFSGVQAPAVDIRETPTTYVIAAEVPGADEQSLTVKIIDGNLRIKGEKREEQPDPTAHYHLTERRYGHFERTFSLPTGVDAEHIQAHFSRGVLNITLPKKPAATKPETSVNISVD